MSEGNDFYWVDRAACELVPIDPSRVVRRPDGAYLIELPEPVERDDDLWWDNAYTPGPCRSRRNMTTVELPHFDDDDALGGPR